MIHHHYNLCYNDIFPSQLTQQKDMLTPKECMQLYLLNSLLRKLDVNVSYVKVINLFYFNMSNNNYIPIHNIFAFCNDNVKRIT
jgi:hypothetical protein